MLFHTHGQAVTAPPAFLKSCLDDWKGQGKMQTTLLEDEFQDGDNRVLNQAMGTLEEGAL